MDGISENMIPKADVEAFEKEMAQVEAEISEFDKTWGFERLDQLADYFSKHADRLNKVYPNWGASIERYRNLKPNAQGKLAEITDSFDRYNFLRDQARMITLLYPEEIKAIYFAEKKTGKFPYLDSLMNIAIKMYRIPNDEGRDPYDVDSPTATAFHRYPILQELSFGAKTPNETSRLFKAKMHPLRLHTR